jgi:cytochrome c oxidase cbb3-type subunit 3
MANNTPQTDDLSGTETTGHEWDGIEELNTPMPRWWLWMFYASIIIGIGYAIAMPSIPLLNSHFKGVLGHSDRASVHKAIDDMNAERSVFATKLLGANLEEIQADPDLFRFAIASGKSAFGDNCATCHGSGAQGFKGYPNLNDDIWLWGGTYEDIHRTLTVGIRAAHDETRISLMQAYGRDELLTDTQISALTQYVLSFSGNETDSELAASAAQLFQETCSTCHGAEGKGDQTQGAPNLTDAEWLYGGSAEDITETLYGGRQGVMPNWDERLAPETISALAVYVHSLGGGADTPLEALEDAP